MSVLRIRLLEEILEDPSVLVARRALSGLAGLSLLGFSACLALSLASWNVSDPSLTHATSSAVTNWMGALGAAWADPAMQIFGLASPLLVAPFALWGWRLLTGRAPGLTAGRLAAGLGALLMAPALLDAFPTTDAWPLPQDLGGVVGEMWGTAINALIGADAGALKSAISGLFGAVALAFLARAVSPPRRPQPIAHDGFQIRRHTPPSDDEYGLEDTDTYETPPSRFDALRGFLAHVALSVRAKWKRSRPHRTRTRTPPPLREALAGTEVDLPEDAAVYRARRHARDIDRAPVLPDEPLFDDGILFEDGPEPRAATDPEAAREPVGAHWPEAPDPDREVDDEAAERALFEPAGRVRRPHPSTRDRRGDADFDRRAPQGAATRPSAEAQPEARRTGAAQGAARPDHRRGPTERDDTDRSAAQRINFQLPMRGPAAGLSPRAVANAGMARSDPDPDPGTTPLDEDAPAPETRRMAFGHAAGDGDPALPESADAAPHDPPVADAFDAPHDEADDGDTVADPRLQPAGSARNDTASPESGETAADDAFAQAFEEDAPADDWDDPYTAEAARHAALRREQDSAPQRRPARSVPTEDSARRVSPAAGAMKPGRRVVRETQPRFPDPAEYEFPPLSLLAAPRPGETDTELTDDVLESNARVLEGVLQDFGVKGEIIHVRPGPVVTLYELEPAPGIKSSRVIGLADDVARSMSAISARVAVIPGKNAIGIELPNRKRVTVFLRELLASEEFERTKTRLPLCLGKTIGGEAVIGDLARMPHLLVAGTTGSGKSVSINTMILSLLYWYKPESCRIILIDPKMLELSVYDGIPHLLTPVVTDPKKAVTALRWAVREMEERYQKMAKLGVRNIDGFNARLRQATKNGEQPTRLVQTGFDRETGEAIFEEEVLDLEPMPFIVVVVDEMADLMLVAGKEIEGAIQRLAQMARAAGIHLIMATQRPSVDVITGTIKANFPTRVSFQVTSKVDSRTILGEMGAEQLLGMGDMLFMAGGGRIQRVHGPFVSDEEVEDVVAHLRQQGAPEYLSSVLEEDEESGSDGTGSLDGMSESDDLYDRAVALVLRDRKASTSYVQRRLSIGYNRAATLIERMEREGVVSPANNAGKREILVPAEGEAA